MITPEMQVGEQEVRWSPTTCGLASETMQAIVEYQQRGVEQNELDGKFRVLAAMVSSMAYNGLTYGREVEHDDLFRQMQWAYGATLGRSTPGQPGATPTSERIRGMLDMYAQQHRYMPEVLDEFQVEVLQTMDKAGHLGLEDAQIRHMVRLRTEQRRLEGVEDAAGAELHLPGNCVVPRQLGDKIYYEVTAKGRQSVAAYYRRQERDTQLSQDALSQAGP